ncbi:MAG: GIY-YIG nuclease family protein [Phormidesmis sp.]
MASWSLYIIRTRQNTLYTGITTDIDKRFAEHSAAGKKGAKYLRAKGPLQLVYSVSMRSHTLAAKAEHRVKKLTKAQKEKIVVQALSQAELLSVLKLDGEVI